MSSYRPEILPTGISRLAVNAVVVTTVLSALAILLAVLRFSLRKGKAFGADDYWLMVSLVLLLVQVVGQYILAFKGGEGWAMVDLVQHPERITWTLALIYFPSLSYSTVVVTIKTSILISYYRIFGHIRRTRYYIYVLLAASWAWGIANFFTLLFQCTPIDKAWHPEKPGHCIQFVPFLWGTSVTNFIIDWLILAVPIAPVLKLRLPNTQKILVGLSFLCGSLACIASTVRSAKTAEFDPTDLGITDYEASVWIFAEPPLAVTSCCLPFLSRLFGMRALRGIRKFRNYVTKGSSNDMTPLPDHDRGGHGQESHPAGVRDGSNPYSHIRKVTTTTMESRKAPTERYEMELYKVSISRPPNSASAARPESQSSLV